MTILTPINSSLFYTCLFIFVISLSTALLFTPWRQLFANQTRQHFLFAAMLGLGIFWLIQINLRDTLGIHLLLITATTIIFGWSLALWIGTLALLTQHGLMLITAALHTENLRLTALPVEFTLSVLIPSSWAWLIIQLVNRITFKNPFTFFLGVGFFGAMTGCLWMGGASVLLFWLTSSHTLFEITREHFPMFFLMMFPEGFTNGAIATVFTVLWPEMVKTYRDDWYLKN